MQVEWRKAVRERSFKLSHDQRRNQRLDGEQLKKRLYFEVINTDAMIGKLKRERTHMEARLTRYNDERAKIKSHNILKQMDAAAAGDEANNGHGKAGPGKAAPRRSQQPTVSFEVVVQAPSDDQSSLDESEEETERPPPPPPPPVFVSKLPGGFGGSSGGGDGTGRRSMTSADGQLFELTESEDELLGEFLERQQRQEDEASSAATPRVLIHGLSLEQFMKKCRSRHLMDSAIERAETFVDEWQAREGGGGAGSAPSGRRRSRRTAGRKMPLEESRDAAATADQEEAAGAGGRVDELEKLERDFKTLLQEAKKARYLRGRNPEIVERDRELTMDEIFQSAKPI